MPSRSRAWGWVDCSRTWERGRCRGRGRPGPPRRAAVIYNPSKVLDWVTFRRHVEYELESRGWVRPLWLETSVDDPGRAMTQQAVAEGVDLVSLAITPAQVAALQRLVDDGTLTDLKGSRS